MANNEIKTNAEIYREQRKERLSKAANKKRSHKFDKVTRILVKVIAIILVVGVVFVGVGNMLTKVFCVPQKVLSVAKYEDKKVTVAEFNYYYMYLFNQLVSTNEQIDSYYGAGYGAVYTGFDSTKSPADQEYKGQDEIEGVETWADYFEAIAPIKALMQQELYERATSEDAKKQGFEISDEEMKKVNEDVDSVIKDFADKAKEQDFSLDNFISRAYGAGLNEKLYREILRRDSIAQLYLTWYEKNITESMTDEDIQKYYKDNQDAFDLASLRLFTVSYAKPAEGSTDPSYTKKEAQARAEEFRSKITDDASFVALGKEYAAPSAAETFKSDSATLADKVSKTTAADTCKALADWAFDAKRVNGESAVIHDEENELYYVVYIRSVAAPDKSTAGADVRHILVKADTTTENSKGEQVALSQDTIDANFAAAKTKAEKILADWKKGEATEETFTALAKEKTDDTGSKETGGLYEDITSTSNYVPEFLNWALADHKVGDTGIVKTDYGYHIMYFVGADKTEKWVADVQAAYSSEEFDKFSTDFYEEISENIDVNDTILKFFVKDTNKLIDRYLSSYTSASSTSY